MSEIYNKEYYLQYDVGVDKVDYSDSEYTKGFLERLAERIVNDLHPKTVLDAGCAMGHLVTALRDKGVEAYGIDISEYAISQVREDVRPYCAAASLTEPFPEHFPKKFDLVVTIEVLEHLYEEDGKIAIQNLCSYTDCVLFSSTPDDFSDPTHFNVRQREYWAQVFAEQGFFDDVNYRPTYLTEYASYFKRSDNWLRQVVDYERGIRLADHQRKTEQQNWTKIVNDKENHINNLNSIIEEKESQVSSLTALVEAKDTHIHNLNNVISTKDQQIDGMSGAIAEKDQYIHNLELQTEKLTEDSAKLRTHYETAMAQREDFKAQLVHYQNQYNVAIAQRDDYNRQLAHYQRLYHEISNATFWKITAPLRACGNLFKRIVKSNRFTHMLFKGLKSLFREGFSVTWKKVKRKLFNVVDYEKARMPLYTEEELAKQRTEQFSRNIKFSILVPLYNTPEKFLHEMILSVQDQTYANWELCLADGSDDAHADVEKICRQYARKDKRILYKKLTENKGISGNTNACIEMATGDYIALFDHDDLLHPAALYEMMKAICEQNADFIYTDENTFQNTPADAYCPHFKADFAPDTLRSYNYICHFTSFDRKLLEKAGGGFRSEFDGSQDYDMVLRLTEQAEHIVHIPKILYYWRSHANSVASDISAKPYTMVAAKRALSEHLERVGLKGEVLDSTIPSTYRIAYEIEGEPLISILIPNKDHIDDLQKCLDSIREKSTYQNWEMIVIENNSTEQATFDYYAEIQKDSRIRVVTWTDEFNYSAINNFGAKSAKGEYVLLLNNDVEIITPDWMEQMLMFAQRDDVGAVGAMLYYPDDTVQHAGVILGIGGVAGHAHKYFPRNSYGYMSRMTIAQNYSCVTAACVLISRSVWDEVEGLDETFKVAFNDVDLCMRIRKAGYLVVWTPYAELYHYESKSRGIEDTPEKQKRFQGEVLRFQDRWGETLKKGDPYYNPNLSLTREDFSLRDS